MADAHFVPSSVPDEGLGIQLLFQRIEKATPDFFFPDRPIHVSRAPGRLDVMSGFGGDDAVALHLPTAEAVCVALQDRDDEFVRLWSPTRDDVRSQLLSIRLGDLGIPDAPICDEEARAFLCADPRDAWSAHVLGPMVVVAREHGLWPAHGFDVLLCGDVPEGSGAGSSAAVQVAVLQALTVAFGWKLSDAQILQACRQAEQRIALGDAGFAAQTASLCGEAGELIVVRGSGEDRLGSLDVPEGLEVVGLGCAIGSGMPLGDDPQLGREESVRAERFAELLRQPMTAESREELGELMYSSCATRAQSGQQDAGVDLVVATARERQAAGAALFGASAAGRGIVVLLGEQTKVWYEALRLKKALRDETGHSGHIFRHSSPGARAFGSVRLSPSGG